MVAAVMSTFAELLQSISESQNDDVRRRELLENLRTALANLPRSELAEAVNQLSLNVLFDCLAENNREEIETICGILKDVMVVSDPLVNIEKYHEAIELGFQHPSEEVRSLVMAQMLRCLEGEENVSKLFTTHSDLVISAMNQIANEDLGVAKNASLVITKLAATSSGFSYLFGANGIAPLKNILADSNGSGAIKFRVYETLAKTSTLSMEHFNEIQKNSMLVEPLCRIAFESRDPLDQLNALEILAIVGETPYGSQAMISVGAYDHLKRLSQNWRSEHMGSVIFPGVLKFIGRVGAQQLPPKELIDIVFDANAESGQDASLGTVAFEALAYIGSTTDGKLYLDKEPRLNKCFEEARVIMENGASEFRCRILEALSHLFGSDEAHSPCLPRWFSLVFPQISVLFNLVQLPFPDIRLCALNFLASIAHLEWAQKHYLRSPGVIEFLTDRNAEPNKDCALAKFKIVSIIVDSATPTILKMLSPETMAALRVHYRQGAFFAAPQSAVAYEGAS